MRIALSCLQSLRDHATWPYKHWESYLKRGIEEAGHEWTEVPAVDWAEAMTLTDSADLARWRDRTWSRTLDHLRVEMNTRPIDMFLSYLFPKMVDETAISEIRRSGVRCVNFYCDNVREFRRVPAEFESFDLHWVPEFEALAMYRAAKLPHVHAPMPCWVPPEFRNTPSRETEPPTFIGSADVLRRDLLGRALQIGSDLVLCGSGWLTEAHETTARVRRTSIRAFLSRQRLLLRLHGWRGVYYRLLNRLRPVRPPTIPASKIRPSVSNSDYIRITREAMVTVGVNRVQTTRASNHDPMTYSRLRDIEAPMLGACYLTEWAEGLAAFYEIGNEIETYRTPSELVTRIKYLQDAPEKRLAMRRAAQRKALAELSVPRTLKKISAALGIHIGAP